MGLIEICLLSVIAAQEPVTQQTAETTRAVALQAPTATTLPPVAENPRKDLQLAEQAGAAADGDLLQKLTNSPDADVAARAAWLLATSSNTAHRSHLPAVVSLSPHPEARLQALQAVRQHADVTSTALAIAALDDHDRRVRTIAAQILGDLRRPAAIEPLIKLLGKSSKLETNELATDVQAGLLALADLGASQHLLRISTAIDDGKAVGVAEPLTYAFQTLSPKNEVKDETTVLVAVLNHKEQMLRRYAINRLAELNSTIALAALESRLVKENEQLRPLLEAAIIEIQSNSLAPARTAFDKAAANGRVIWSQTAAWWNSLTPTQKATLGAVPITMIWLLWLIRRAALRRSREDDALANVALVQPSDQYLDDQDADSYEDSYEDDQYGENEECDAFEVDDNSFDDGAYEQPQTEYDTSGWEAHNEDNILSNSTPENETFR